MNIYYVGTSAKLVAKHPCYRQHITHRFANGELQVSVKSQDTSVIVCSIQTHQEFVELLLLIDALKYSDVYIVLLYMFYTRHDHDIANKSIGAKITQKMLEQSNVRKIITIDSHSDFFSRPHQDVSAFDMFADDIRRRFDQNITIVAPDSGISKKAMKLAQDLGVKYAQCQKERQERVQITTDHNFLHQRCVLVDDIIDSYDTIQSATALLIDKGASEVYCYCTHGVLSPGAEVRIGASPITEVMITDSIYRDVRCSKIRVLSLSKLLSNIIDGML